jgi:hypothetical protein
MNDCVDCGARIGIRATRCKPCRRVYRTAYENGRAAKAREEAQESGASHDLSSTEVGREVVDYTKGGHKVPSFSGVSPEPMPVREAEVVVVDYTHGGHAAPGQGHRLDYSNVPGEARRDFVRASRMAAQNSRLDEDAPEVASWEILTAVDQGAANTVNFSGPMMDISRQRPTYAITNPAAAGMAYGTASSGFESAAAGNAVRVARPQPKSGPQRTPHIL